MSFKTFFTRSFSLSADNDGAERAVLFVQNHHDDATLTDVSIELKVPDSLVAEETVFSIDALAPGERVELTRVARVEDGVFASGSITADCRGRVDGEDVDHEKLTLALEI